jgi:hypothetical protein
MVNVFGANIGGEELEEVRSCLESSWMGIGKKVQKFETELSQRNSLPGLVMVDSGSNALQLAIQLLHHRGLQPKSKIIVPSFTWVDFIDESEVLTPADPFDHVEKHSFKIPFVCGAKDLGEALRRIHEGAAMIRASGRDQRH